MSENSGPVSAVDEYAAAHAAHYTAKNLREALQLYLDLINAHPGSPEARYSRTQILNIAKGVVPERVLLDSQLKLAFAMVGHSGRESNARGEGVL